MREVSRTRELAVYDFCAGTDSRAYEHFGVHRAGEGRYVFRLYAPLAGSVSLVGDFLPAGECAMLRGEDGIWTVSVTPDMTPEGMAYAYRLDGGRCIADPFARGGMADDGVSATVRTASGYRWQDELWMQSRGERQLRRGECPINVYRVHLSSFATRRGQSCESADASLNYRELGELLARYVADMGYTHVRLMPLIGECRPLRGCEGYFAPSGRHGSPDDLRAMIDRIHRAGIGVLMDLPFDRCERDIPQVTAGGIFDVRRPEAKSFLLSVTLFWLRSFHLDGVCPVGHSLWKEADGDFLDCWCAAVRSCCPDALLLSEEAVDGEGDFDLVIHSRLDEDIRRCVGADERQWDFLCDRLTLTLREVTASGHGVLLPPTEHLFDGKGEAPREGRGYLARFDAARLILAYRMAHPGKKQAFMGEELGQRRPWDGSVPPDWFLRELPTHAAFWQYVRGLNHFYRAEPRLWECESAELIRTEAASVALICRTDCVGRKLIVLANFSDSDRTVRLQAGKWGTGLRVLFGTDGVSAESTLILASSEGILDISLPPLGAVFCEPWISAQQPIRQFLLSPGEFQKSGG